MKTLEDLKAALSTATYQEKFGHMPLGKVENIQAQFDEATEFPTHVSYMDLGWVQGATAIEIKTLLLDEDGNVIGEEDSVFVAPGLKDNTKPFE